MADGSLGQVPELFARLASSCVSERDTIVAHEISQIRCDLARRGMMGSSNAISQYHKACQVEMDARGAELFASLKRIVLELRLCPFSGMAEALKGVLRPYLMREADKLTKMACPRTEHVPGGVSVHAVRPKCDKYDVEIDLFIGSISAAAAVVPAMPSVSVAAAHGSNVFLQIGGNGNRQNAGNTNVGLDAVDALVGQTHERIYPGFHITDEAYNELALMVHGLLTEAGKHHGNRILVQALRDYKNTLDWILHNRGSFESASDLDEVRKELEEHYQACAEAIRTARNPVSGNAVSSIVTDRSDA